MKELESSEERYYCYSNSGLVESFEVEVVHEDQVGDYQGDDLFILRDGERYGFLSVGYGSCSGCDYLEGLGNDLQKVTEYRDELWEDIEWKESRQEMIEFLETRDWDLQWYGRQAKKFVADALQLLKS